MGLGAREAGTANAPITHYLHSASRPVIGAFLAIMRWLDNDRGYPIPSYRNGVLDPAHPTLHATMPAPDCTVPGGWSFPLTDALALRIAVLKVYCNARVDAGATGPCVEIAAAPALVTSLDAGVPDDGGTCW